MKKPTLCFRENGQFRILMISDFHAYRNPKLEKDYCDKMIQGIEALIQETKPDFVMLGGDQCIGASDISQVKQYMQWLLQPLLTRHLPWAAVFGNHDNEMGLPVSQEEQAYEQIEGCLNQAGPEELEGTGNYCIPIFDHTGEKRMFSIFGLDSHREIRDLIPLYQLPQETKIILPRHFNDGQTGRMPDFEQVMWYYQTSREIEKQEGRKIPAVMFMHIPIPEFLHVVRNPEHCNAIGSKREALGCSEINTGLFAACLQRGDVKGMFFGHEHLCDLQGQYCGITMAQDAAIGYNMSAHDDLRGGRVIDLYEDGNIQTHTVKLIDLLGRQAMRREDYFEGGCKYFIRDL